MAPEQAPEPRRINPETVARLQTFLTHALREARDTRQLDLVTEDGLTPDEAIDATDRDTARRIEGLKESGQQEPGPDSTNQQP